MTPEDVARETGTQADLLEAAAALVAPGGRLVYATCSVLKQGNEEEMINFLSKQSDAGEIRQAASWGNERPVGRQILPGDDGMDGFYYAALRKTNHPGS